MKKKEHTILSEIGEAQLIKTSISETKYAFAIMGQLDSKLKKAINLDKDHIIILLVSPMDNTENVISADANFHLKSNYTWDFGMRVGGVILTKEL